MDSRRFDFALYNQTTNRLFLIEVNYYSSGGSKLKATAGEYQYLNDFLNTQGVEFIWITDGKGWSIALNLLEETFNHNNYVFNLDMLKRGILCSLPHLKLDIGIEFDVIILVAILMHLNLEEIVISIQNLKKYLVNGGLIIVSYSTTPRDDNERFFEDLRGGVIEKIFLDSGFELVENNKSLDSLGRGIEWRSEVFTLDKQILKTYNVGNKN